MSYKLSIIGAGNGGQAFAGHLGMLGYDVTLYNRDIKKLDNIKKNGGIFLEGIITGFGKINKLTDKLEDAILDCDIIMITTTADAHRQLAEQICPYLKDGQILILNPGRTCGAIEFRHVLKQNGLNKRIFVGEAQTLIYACRIIENGYVNIIGVKDKVLYSALPSTDTSYTISILNEIFNCFFEATNVMQTSLENIGAIFHPSVVLFNAAGIERGNVFYFYRDMTDQVANFITQLDRERLNLGKAFGVDLISCEDWISYAYKNIPGTNLCEKMKNNKAYNDILAPTKIRSRQLTEDIPTGILPYVELGTLAKVDVKLARSILNISSVLLDKNIIDNGRTLERLGLKGLTIKEIIKTL